MNGEYQILIDTWEGQLEIDEAVLKANGVAGMLIRLNDIRGGHHKDENFDNQWAQAKGFVRAPYFVYNPWKTGKENFEWLKANMPANAKSVAVDVEVRKDGYSPVTYGAEVKKFWDLAKVTWKTVIYTGEWFLPVLTLWPTDAPYWWAQYPNAFYTVARSLTWDQLREELKAFTGPSNTKRVPGRLVMWQLSGDRLTLPGNAKPMDVNVFFGSYAQLEALFGPADVSTPDVPPPPPPQVDPVTESEVYLAVAEAAPIIVRKYPQAVSETQTSLRILTGEMFQGRIWAGNGYVWLQIETSSRHELFGLWVAVRKIDGSGKLIKLIPLNVVPPTDEIPGSRIFQLRDGRDPYLLQKIGFGEFSWGHLTKWSARGGLGDIHQVLYLDDKDQNWLDYLLDVQLKDRHVEIEGKDTLVDRNMQKNWLYGDGRPYYDKNKRFAFGDCVVPSQPIRIRTDVNGKPIIKRFDEVRLRDGTYNKVPMVKIDGFTPAMRSKPVDWLIKHAYIVDWTAISPSGKITKPLGMRQINWEPDSFESNMGEKFIPLFYIKGYEL